MAAETIDHFKTNFLPTAASPHDKNDFRLITTDKLEAPSKQSDTPRANSWRL
ncbi:hypothetical protein ZHAS_00004685 [Anopheles sinensis]|uniref:Uncharacterized protein n=1 Tax=Anopheles sinensis TaxID=74873 RepID=A0A084VHE3_ANOSI|nr:hypothetical protein ZHAS_00004685 [Anopheles sinensis]